MKSNPQRFVPIASAALGLLTLACAIASCATSSEVNGTGDEPSTLLDAGGQQADRDGDASPDADCDAGDAGCTTRELTCAEADFCLIPAGVDSRYALFGVWGSSATDVWAVGSAGTIVHWDGAAWTKVPFDRKETLRGVWGSSASDVWIVSGPELILHGSGFQGGAGRFTAEPSLDPETPWLWWAAITTSIWGTGPGDFFVGGPPTPRGPQNSLWRHTPSADANGAPSWEVASTYCTPSAPCFQVNGIWGTSRDDVWLVGNGGGLLRSKGPVGESADGGADQWSRVKTTLTTADLHGIWGSSASDVWIVGEEGTIRHWSNDGKQRWDIVSSPTKENLRAVWGTGPSDAWAVGDAGTILHWDGKAWSIATATLPLGAKPRLYGVWGSGPNDVWVVGEAIALHFTGPKARANEGAR